MARFEITSPDGKRFEIEAPDGASQEQILAYAQSQFSGTPQPSTRVPAPAPSLPRKAQPQPVTSNGAVGTFARGAVQGATFNLGDEIFAGFDALAQPIFGNGNNSGSLGERYDRNLAHQRAQYRADAEAHPVADIAGNIVGGLAGPAKFAAPVKGVWSLAREGAKAGAAYGFGAGEGGFTNRLMSTAEGGAVGGLTGGALGGAGKLYEKVRPANVAANYVNKQFNKAQPVVDDSAKAMHEVGQVYTPGQATGSRGLLTIEGLLRRHPASADKMAEFDQKQLTTSLDYLDRTLTGISKESASPDVVGKKVSDAFDDVLTKAVTTRRSMAKQDFDRVDELAGNYRVFKPENLFGEIDDLSKQFLVPGGGDASHALVRQMQGIKQDILEKAGPKGLTAKEVQRLLEVYGGAARGSGAIFKDIDTAQQRMIAGKLQQAIFRDVDAAAESNTHKGAIAEALKTARNNYRENSTGIDALESSVLGRMFGGNFEKSPERIAQAVKNMTPTELRASFAVLEKSDPAVAQAAKRFLVEDAMAAAGRTNSSAPQAQIAGEDVFSPAKYLTAIRKSPVWDAFNAKEKEQMTASVRDLERLSFRAGTDGSPTAPLNFAWDVMKALGSGGLALSPTQVGKSVGAVVLPRKAVKALTTPEGQANLTRYRRQNPNSAANRAATIGLSGLFATNGAVRQPYDPDESLWTPRVP